MPKIIRDVNYIDEKYKNAVIALGNFDGVHVGHRAIIKHASDIAKAENRPLALMSFEPHPREFFAKEKAIDGLHIFNLRSKIKTIKSLGVDCIFLLRFNKELASLSADDFIREVLVKKLNAKHIVTGDNFYFGENRTGDKNFLADEAKRLGFSYTAHHQITDNDDNLISSSAIRKLLKQGNIKQSSALLGQNYHISGRVKHGLENGRKLGFPTANIALDKLSLPRFGVYAVRISIDGNNQIGVANLGVKPSLGEFAPLLEVHLFDFEEDLYGKRLCVEFVDFIRDEQKFASLDELKNQIAKDCESVKLFC